MEIAIGNVRPARQRRSYVAWRSRHGLLFVPVLLLLVPLFLFPTVFLLSKSVTDGVGGLGNFRKAASSELVRVVLLRSFGVAAVVSLLSLLVGLPFAAVVKMSGPRMRVFLLGAVSASLFTSVIVRAYAWLALLGRNGPVEKMLSSVGINVEKFPLVHSRFGVLVGMVQYGIPFMVLAIFDVMNRLDPVLDKAAATLGAGSVTRWVKIKLPLLAPGIAAGITIVFVTTLGYFVIPSVLGSPRELMIGQLIAQQVGKTLNWGYAAALATILLAVTLVLVLLFRRLSAAVAKY